jgi:hypothetical protein
LKNTKLVTLLSTFSPSEIRRFRDFVKSPFFNKNKNVIRFNEVLLSFYPEFNPKKLTEEYIYSEVFGKEKFDYHKIKNISSDLYNLGLEYLKQTTNPETDFIPEFNLMVQLRQRRLFKLHKKIVNTLQEDFKKEEIKGSEFLYNNYLVTRESQLVDLFEKPSSITGILSEFESFYDYLIFHLLQYYNLMIHIGKGNNVNIDMKMIDEVVSYLEKGPVSSHPTTISYQYLILLKLKGNEEYYFTLKEHYFKYFAQMDPAAAYRTHMHMFGYCADMYNFNGDRRFIFEGYELYKHSYLNNRVTSGELLYPDFCNFVKVFVRAGDYDLARKFISDYKARLPEEQLDNSINYSNAYIAYYEGEFEKALADISKVNFPLAIMKVQVKIMEVQLNYQLGYYEETRGLIDSFKKTLQREVIVSDDYKNSILGFLRLLTTLINIKQETSPKEAVYMLDKLKEELNNKQPNHFGIKFWMQDRISEIDLKR